MRLKLTWNSEDIMRPNDAHTFEVGYTTPKQCRTAVSVITKALSVVLFAKDGQEIKELWAQLEANLKGKNDPRRDGQAAGKAGS